MSKVLKPELDEGTTWEPFRLYKSLFQKKGHGRQTIYKIYALVC